MPGRFRQVLGDSGAELSPEELLDVLWLARSMPSGADDAPLARALGSPGPAPAADPDHPSPPGTPPAPDGPPPPPGRPMTATPGRPRSVRRPGALHAAADRPDTRRPDRQDTGDAGDAAAGLPERPALPVRAPEGKALGSDELRLGRALRPLKQRHQIGRNWELDEDATAAAMADTGLPEVVLRPTLERWLDLALVVDDGLSMLLWHRLAVELRSLTERLGAFRNLRVYGLDSRARQGPHLRDRPYDPGSPVLSTAAVSDPSGHTLVLVVSDGVGAAWRDGRMSAVLGRWAHCGPTAIVHALPARMWRSSGIRAENWRVTTRRRGAANDTWQVTDPVLPPGVADWDGIPVPVLEPHPVAVARWAGLVASPGGSAVLPLADWDLPGQEPEAAVAAGGTSRDPVLRFRDTASPQAYRLAAHLAAVAPVSVPVMRLVQAAVPWRAETAHLAEVFLGGLMRRTDPREAGALALAPEHQRFDFAEGDREILLDVAPPSELARTSRAVAQKLASLAGRSPDFPAWLAHPHGTDRLADRARPFAWLDSRLMAHLGAPPAEAPATRGGRDGGDSAVPNLTTPPSAWRGLRGDDPRYVGPYKLIARSDVRGTAIAYLGLDGQGSEAVVQVAGPRGRGNATAFVSNDVAALTRMAGNYAPHLIAGGPDDRMPWLALELVTTDAQISAPTLRAVAQAYGALGASDFFLRLCWHLSRAVGALTEKGIVHGALTPDAVLVTEHTVRITHFMSAQIDGVSPAGSASTYFALDSAYHAPEVLAGRGHGPEADVYSLAALAVAASTGQITHRLIRQSLLPSLSVSLLPRTLHAVLARCLDPHPAGRPSAAEVTAAVEACLPELPREEAPPRSARTDAPAGRLIALRRDARSREPNDEYEKLIRAIRTPVTGGRRISVTGPGKNLGSTTITALLGAVLAEQRGDRVLAIDIDVQPSGVRVPLSGRFYQNAPYQLRDPSANRPKMTGYESLLGFMTTDTSGLTVVTHGAMTRTEAGWRRTDRITDAYRNLIGWVAPHFDVILTDEADESAKLVHRIDQQYEHTDSLIVVAGDPISLGHTFSLLERLALTRPRLAREAVVVINKARDTFIESNADLINRVSERCRGVVMVPYDTHLASSSVLLLDWLADDTYEMALRLAALVGEGFATSGAGSGTPEA